MRKSVRAASALLAGALTAALALINAGPAYAADPTTMTSGFYADPDNSALRWTNANPGDGRSAAIRTSIANTPAARWFGNWSGDIGTATGAYVGRADSADKLPILVAYNIPNRDICAGQSGGGAGSRAAYDAWIAAFASGIGSRPAVVVLEPDALGHESCMTAAQIAERNAMLKNAIAQFNAKAPNTWVYLDAGNPGWIGASTMAQQLAGAGVGGARGFVLNVSNYFTNDQNSSYGNAVNSALSSYGYTKPFVVDTSRNGNGSNGQWCNPAGRRIGTPTQRGGGAEMLLWIKIPGESDGNCGVGAGSSAGQFLPEVAYKMIYGY
ncbi:glycoside hydrolase family 6 protein [Streptomyces sp. NBC_00536]|uniref:glycoside hydrolase family 6 protein n=1 Tax=Streptomyces sp. NBC_00536 TaxID=2975769 RepID=UPI002E7FBA59|nr:glycoside hydrolase family 6 protein [Streptomyces sp. NBC_00536]WUC77453.1 glycoside hydrolase family 6 protein [Streptomyces sp. NBC_00536]